MIAELVVFVGVLALGQFSPGPDMVLLTRTALAKGRVAGWWTTLGIATGLVLHAAVAIGGMAYLVAQGGVVEMTLRILAAGYLGWLGLQLCRAALRARLSSQLYDIMSAMMFETSNEKQTLFSEALEACPIVRRKRKKSSAF